MERYQNSYMDENELTGIQSLRNSHQQQQIVQSKDNGQEEDRNELHVHDPHHLGELQEQNALQQQQAGTGIEGNNEHFSGPRQQVAVSNAMDEEPLVTTQVAEASQSQQQEGVFSNVGQGLIGEYRDMMMHYWQETINSVERDEHDFKNHQLPLARIKKVMKTDGDVRMISAEAPILFAKGCDIFITELTMRAWIHAEENKRRTLQKSDIAAALTKSDMFDFLIDIVPREERPKKTFATSSRSSSYTNTPSMVSSLPGSAQLYVMPHHSRTLPGVINDGDDISSKNDMGIPPGSEFVPEHARGIQSQQEHEDVLHQQADRMNALQHNQVPLLLVPMLLHGPIPLLPLPQLPHLLHSQASPVRNLSQGEIPGQQQPYPPQAQGYSNFFPTQIQQPQHSLSNNSQVGTSLQKPDATFSRLQTSKYQPQQIPGTNDFQNFSFPVYDAKFQ